MRGILLAAGLAALVGCGSDGTNTFDGGTDAQAGDSAVVYANVVVDPPDVTLNVPITGGASQAYKAYADVSGQTHVDVTAQCTFKVADSSLGTFNAATFSSAARGGDTVVTATCGSAQGTGNLHLLLKGWILATGAPSNSPSIFGGATAATDPQHTPALEYPLDGAVRDYGHKLTKTNTASVCVANGVQQCKQIWVGAIDKATLSAKSPPDDPSFAPVWMPGQDLGADNISPYWTKPTSAIPQ